MTVPDPSGSERRSLQLDTIASILPIERRDTIASLLTDQDIETLRHLVNEGMGENTLRALASDLTYLEAWSQAATGNPLPWPAPEALLLKFVAHHLWDPEKRLNDPDHGMPDAVTNALRVAGLLRSSGPHSPATVRRRLASWSTLTQWRGLRGAFAEPSVRTAMRLATRALARPRQRKSTNAITGDILTRLLSTCKTESLVDLRDRALLLLAFASGGRRRSELVAFRLEDLAEEDPVPANPSDPQSPPLPCLSLHLGRTKTTAADHGAKAYLIGYPVTALRQWLTEAGIEGGAIFRRIDQWGNIDRRALNAQSVNLILKSRCQKAGLDPAQFSAHGLRSGYLTEAANRGIPLQEAMQQSQHRSVIQAAAYYNNSERRLSRAARLVSEPDV
jgi:integrase